ncbi:hypothetical protein DC3_23190 [Deinococcus cellulosilyticus NBRC 106333 = KACC 11606]|uniref:Uncharacterized protein n=1 Tax=Deinococcus cellulosilyticus (strain DSM 18568 / NBRC 106333 / KACC 11606 / 5516J-15) TaxID=1223518 RepID=A0A511N1D6_DEIC1|nr:hypothetical protein DC3_23190 [Deinococcus cellulosilyticus NBRC 106333 = KACC 11606]
MVGGVFAGAEEALLFEVLVEVLFGEGGGDVGDHAGAVEVHVLHPGDVFRLAFEVFEVGAAVAVFEFDFNGVGVVVGVAGHGSSVG